MAEGYVIRNLAEWLIVALVLFALLCEVLLHKLEHWVHQRHPSLQSVLRNLYRELMILGVVSFGFILYAFTAPPTKEVKNYKLTFEVAHVFIFLFAVFHTITVAVSVFISLRLSMRWKRLERMDLVKYLDHKEKYRKLNEKRNVRKSAVWRHCIWYLINPRRLVQYRTLHEIMTFHDIRWQFIYYRNLQPDFRFAKFLRKIKFATFIELVEIHPVNWILLLILVLLDIIRVKAGGIVYNFEPIVLICHSAFSIFAVTLLAWKIRRVYWKMTKNPATYYDTIDPTALRVELAIAEEEARIRRESRAGTDSDEWEAFHGRHTTKSEVSSPTKRLSRSGPRKSRDHGTPRQSHDGKHQPVYANMAFVPGKHGHGAGVSEVDRHSLDMSKGKRGQRAGLAAIDSNVKPARYVPGDEEKAADSKAGGDVAGTLLEKAKKAAETKNDVRMSVDVAAALPTHELHKRDAPPDASLDEHDLIEDDENKLKHMSTSRRRLRMEAVRRLRERKRRNAGIVQTAQEVQRAERQSPTKNFPGWVVWMFPRLGRVPSAAERLFWFGSHRFYLFCVENVLFFANINLSATIAKISLLAKTKEVSRAAAKAAAAKPAAKFLLETAIRAPAKVSNPNLTKPQESLSMLYAALAVGIIALLYVLMRIAGIMKKYIFILNNANLLPEDMTIDTISTMNVKDMMEAETMHDGQAPLRTEYDSEIDDDENNYSQMRRNMSSFLQSENKHGMIMTSPVIETDENFPMDRRI